MISVSRLIEAINRGDFAQATQLIKEKNIDIKKVRDSVGRNLLHIAVATKRGPAHNRDPATYHNPVTCLEFLLDNGILEGEGAVLINAKSKRGSYTPLHVAARDGHADCIKILIMRGASLKETDAWGQNALHIAAFKGHADCVQILVNSGAPVDTQDTAGRTPLNLARQKNYKEIIAIFSQSVATKDGSNAAETGNIPLSLKRMQPSDTNLPTSSKVRKIDEGSVSIGENPLTIFKQALTARRSAPVNTKAGFKKNDDFIVAHESNELTQSSEDSDDITLNKEESKIELR